MEKLKVYYSAVSGTEGMNKWAEEGFDIVPRDMFGDTIIYKTVKISEDDIMCRSMIENYNDPKKQKYFWNEHSQEYLKSIGLGIYKKNGRYSLDLNNPKCKESLTTLRFEVLPTSGGICRLSPYDLTAPVAIYAAKLIYPYLSEDIRKWEDKGLLTHKFLAKNA